MTYFITFEVYRDKREFFGGWKSKTIGTGYAEFETESIMDSLKELTNEAQVNYHDTSLKIKPTFILKIKTEE